MGVMIFGLVFGCFGADAAKQDWDAMYSQAHQYRDISPAITAALFRQVADNAEPELATRALLQLGNLYRIGMMEPRKALGVYEELAKRPNIKQHPGFADAERTHQSLKTSLAKVDALEAKLSSGTLTAEDKGTTGVLCAIADVYRGPLDTPKYAFEAYKRAFEVTSGTFDMAYYMMGHMKMDEGELAQAVEIFGAFMQRFPKSEWFESAFELYYRCQYLQVFANKNPAAQSFQARELTEKIDKALADYPKVDPIIRTRLQTLQRLMKPMIVETPQTPAKPR
jgi:tetratricopeptide (TPR) repeat protein